MIRIISLLMLTNILLVGCYHPPHPTVTRINDCCITDTPPSPCIPLSNEANVRLPGKVKAYAVNRYIDPANPRVMHERHVMYRVEEDPTWKLATDESRQVLIGNTLTNGKLNYNPVIMEKELALELQRQRIINEALQTHSEMLIDTGSALSQEHEIMQERSDQLRKALEEQGKVIEELKERLDFS